MHFKNISKETLKIPCAILTAGESVRTEYGSDFVQVPPGETFDVAMGYAVPKVSDGGARLASVVERKTTKYGSPRSPVEPVDPEIRAIWKKAPSANWYHGIRNDPWRKLHESRGPGAIPVMRGGRAFSAAEVTELEAVPDTPATIEITGDPEGFVNKFASETKKATKGKRK